MRKQKLKIRRKAAVMSGSFVMASLLTGCAGLEVGGTAGLYRVDERESRQATRIEQTNRPLKCWFTDCPPVVRGGRGYDK
jgi:hypothetical protein